MDEKIFKSFLTACEKSELLQMHRSIKHKRKAYRINTIILLNKGYSKTEVERLLLIDRKSILKDEKDFRKGGLKKIVTG